MLQKKNGTWTLTSLPPGKRALGCKSIYHIKLKFDGMIERYKAPLVILGNNQIEGQEFTETFALVVKLDTFCTRLAVTIARGWELHP